MDDPYCDAYGAAVFELVSRASEDISRLEALAGLIARRRAVSMKRVPALYPTRPFRLLPRRRTGGNMPRDGPGVIRAHLFGVLQVVIAVRPKFVMGRGPAANKEEDR